MMTLFAATRLIPRPPARVEMRNNLILKAVALLKYLHQIFLVSADVLPSSLDHYIKFIYISKHFKVLKTDRVKSWYIFLTGPFKKISILVLLTHTVCKFNACLKSIVTKQAVYNLGVIQP